MAPRCMSKVSDMDGRALASPDGRWPTCMQKGVGSVAGCGLIFLVVVAVGFVSGVD